MKPQLVLMKDEDFDVRKVVFDLNDCWLCVKPASALWTSSAFKEGSKVISEWYNFLRYDWYDEETAVSMRKFLLYPKENARVFEVNGREDADRLPWKDVVWEDVGFFRVIDFEALAKEYDGLHLTEEGNCRLHMSEFNPWDVESTVWFNVDWIERIVEL